MAIRLRVMPDPNSAGARRVRKQKQAVRQQRRRMKSRLRALARERTMLQRQVVYLQQLLGLQAVPPSRPLQVPSSVFGYPAAPGSLLAPFYGAAPYGGVFDAPPAPSHHGAYIQRMPLTAGPANPSSPFGVFAGLLGLGGRRF